MVSPKRKRVSCTNMIDMPTKLVLSCSLSSLPSTELDPISLAPWSLKLVYLAMLFILQPVCIANGVINNILGLAISVGNDTREINFASFGGGEDEVCNRFSI